MNKTIIPPSAWAISGVIILAIAFICLIVFFYKKAKREKQQLALVKRFQAFSKILKYYQVQELKHQNFISQWMGWVMGAVYLRYQNRNTKLINENFNHLVRLFKPESVPVFNAVLIKMTVLPDDANNHLPLRVRWVIFPATTLDEYNAELLTVLQDIFGSDGEIMPIKAEIIWADVPDDQWPEPLTGKWVGGPAA